nr:hypothetical protein [Chthoniobacterales bacterium]
MPAPDIQFSATVNDAQLDRKIIEFAVATQRSVKDLGEQVIKGLVKDVIEITPPYSGRDRSATRAKRVGELAVYRDLALMGFSPVTIKGYREINTVFGRKVAPVRVKTKPNPRFADPESHRRARLASKHGGRPTRGGKQAFYVDKRLFTPMRNRLIKEVGRLAAGWIPAAQRLGVAVPAFILRHAGDNHGGSIEISYANGIQIRAVNHMPGGAATIAADTQRRIEAAKGYAIGKLTRQLE